MHELSLAQSIAEIAVSTLGDQELPSGFRVRSVRVRIGDLSGVDAGALSFCFEVVRAGWPETGDAALLIERVPARLRCKACGAVRDLEERPETCPGCGDLGSELISGRELEVFGVELVSEE